MNNTGQEGSHASHPMQLSAEGPEDTAPGLAVLSPGPLSQVSGAFLVGSLSDRCAETDESLAQGLVTAFHQ